MKLNELKEIIPDSQDWCKSEQISFGWSGEQKYKITNTKSKTMLLRLLTKEQYEMQRNGIEFLYLSGKVCEFVPKILDKGYTTNSSFYFLLLEYIEGEDGMKVINNYSLQKQYELGVQMGKIIRKLHDLSKPSINKEENKKFKEKVAKFNDYFLANKSKFSFLKDVEKVIKEFQQVIDVRPMIMLHNDFHLGNMVINKDKIYLIDFNRASMGDSIKEFDALAWSAKYSIPFAKGLLDEYLKGEDKNEFFKILRGYIAIWQVQMLYFIQDQDDEEKQTVLDLIKFVESWYDKSEYIPNWYIESME